MSQYKILPLAPVSWQQLQAQAIRSPEQLLRRLQLPASLLAEIENSSLAFSLRVPEPYLQRIEPGNPDDPLLRQILPLAEELHTTKGFSCDPVGDGAARNLPGLLHKYHGRVLIITTGSCGIHCRYCFRRHYPYNDDRLSDDHWQGILGYLREDPNITEVILSGGDPLTLSDQRLQNQLQDLAEIPHLQRLRIHSRQPIVLPQRVNDELLQMLAKSRLQTVLVVHVNHANELDGEVKACMQQLKQAGITLLNQSVLLRGVNDDANSLCELSERLFECGILPYYLHQLDRVVGAAHFEVDELQTRSLMEELRRRLPGYLVPKLVSEQAGAAYKLPLDVSIST
ncbi:MAG: EF-P beta-lysylation protein EpmB [Gammaproteobacteria bacterium]|nr:EF-P beta-lysylation protein EpmB [Gammaproteobacteria bacterium]